MTALEQAHDVEWCEAREALTQRLAELTEEAHLCLDAMRTADDDATRVADRVSMRLRARQSLRRALERVSVAASGVVL